MMNISCVICSELYVPSDEIYSTKCGHVFHQACLLQWIERSSTCPQCRKKVTEKNICKIYFDFVNTSGITLDAPSLQVKLDNAQFQIRLRDKEVTALKEECNLLQSNFLQTEEKLLNAKEKLKSKEVAISGLKEQNSYLMTECKGIRQLRDTNENLRKQIDLLKGLEEVIYGTLSEVQSMVSNSTQQDLSKLSTYVVVLKRAVIDSESKKKSARDNLQAAQNQLSKVTLEKQVLESRAISLQESLLHSEDEIERLKNHVKELEEMERGSATTSCGSLSYKAVPSSGSNISSPNNTSGTPVKRKMNYSSTHSGVSACIKDSLPSTSKENSSPYLDVKQCGNPVALPHMRKSLSAASFAPYSSQANGFSIFKKSRLTENMKSENDLDVLRKRFIKKTTPDIDYDGLGGHSKLDVFPVPVSRSSVAKLTTKKLSMKNIMRRVGRPSNQNTINDAFKKAL